ncbi:MAG: endolytic transglycosylase MltG [Candidatus Falkowbacteria bacterium]
MRIVVKIGLIIFSVIVFFGVLSAGLLWWQLNHRPSVAKQELKTITIPRGAGVEQIGALLEEKGIITSPWLFKLAVRYSGEAQRLQAGQYVLPTGLSLLELATRFSQAKREQVKVILREGESLRDLAKTLNADNVVASSTFYQVVGLPLVDYRTISSNVTPWPRNYSKEFNFLADKPEYFGLEGYLFPDTYNFDQNSQPEQVLFKMLNNFERKVTPEMRQAVASQGKTLWQTIIMASIVEKEVRDPEEMKLVADLFWRRIARGQALQSDATLSYFLNDTVAAHSGADLETDTPYNSYKYTGLPPTPIGNPGLAAITAAIYPTANQYNYFLNDLTTGKTYFAKTYAEHISNKQKYLK